MVDADLRKSVMAARYHIQELIKDKPLSDRTGRSRRYHL